MINLKTIERFKKLNYKNTNQILKLQNAIENQEGAIPYPAEISMMTQTKINYLLSILLQVEYKIIAENIRFIIGRNERGVLVSLMNPGPCLYFKEEELKKLNNYREISLFKVHKCGFKSNRHYYSHNKFFENTLKGKSAAAATAHLEKIDFKELKPSSTANPKNEDLVCHHCKYVGRRSFFYVCSHRQFESKKQDRDLHFKHIFAVESDQESRCERAYCSYCVRNFYNIEVRKDCFICPFCTNRCYCPTCDYRDFYIRIFDQYIELGGCKEVLISLSPIQKIIFQIEDWQKKNTNIVKLTSRDESSNMVVERYSRDYETTKGRFDFYQWEKKDSHVYRKYKDTLNQKKSNLISFLQFRRSAVTKLRLFRLLTEREEKKKEKLMMELSP